MKKYIVSRQGNRNLMMSQGAELLVRDNLTEARAEANRRTINDGAAWFVFEIEPRLLFSYRPRAEEIAHDTTKP